MADPTTDDVRVEPVARVLWNIARSEYDYDWDSNADTYRDEARQVLAAADATERDARIRAEAVRAFGATLGVNVGDEDDVWWSGYRQGQREALHSAREYAARVERGEYL